MKLCIKTTDKFSLAKNKVRQIFSCKGKAVKKIDKKKKTSETAVQLELQADFTNKVETGEQQEKAQEEEIIVQKASEQEQEVPI